jgi:hypothetical protein
MGKSLLRLLSLFAALTAGCTRETPAQRDAAVIEAVVAHFARADETAARASVIFLACEKEPDAAMTPRSFYGDPPAEWLARCAAHQPAVKRFSEAQLAAGLPARLAPDASTPHILITVERITWVSADSVTVAVSAADLSRYAYPFGLGFRLVRKGGVWTVTAMNNTWVS